MPARQDNPGTGFLTHAASAKETDQADDTTSLNKRNIVMHPSRTPVLLPVIDRFNAVVVHGLPLKPI